MTQVRSKCCDAGTYTYKGKTYCIKCDKECEVNVIQTSFPSEEDELYGSR